MKKHSDYITHINNSDDLVYLRTSHFPVSMRLFNTSPEYKSIILQQCNYIRELCLDVKEGYKKPHGMSSANAGLSFNIIGIIRNRNKANEFCEIFINPKIISYGGNWVTSLSNCGSLTLDEPIEVERNDEILVEWFDENGDFCEEWINGKDGGFTIQHEVDHNLGILITDKVT